MKKLIGLGLLMVTGLTAFAAPAAAACYTGREVVVVRHNDRVPARHAVRVQYRASDRARR